MNKKNNFTKRFGATPRIVLLLGITRSSSRQEARYQNEKIFKAFGEVLTNMLGRPANDQELFGEVNLKIRKEF